MPKICDIPACNVNLAKLFVMVASTVDVGAISGSLEFGLKLDAPFLPGVGFTVLKLPEDLMRVLR